MIQTAEEFFEENKIIPFHTDNFQYNEIYNIMIEFAKMHVEAALKAADNNAQVDIVDWNDPGFNLTEPATPIYGVDNKSILSAYPLTNII
jgi:hypothetical protein